MKAYWSFFRIRFIGGLQYRAAAWGGLATQFAWGSMFILMYRAFYLADASAFPLPFQAVSGYIWLQQAFLTLLMSWYYDNDILNAVSSGGIAYELCRPADLYAMWFTKQTAVRLSRAVLRCMPILIVAAFLPKPYGLTAPVGVTAALLFPLSMFLGLLVATALSMLVHVVSFYTVSPMGIRILFVSLSDFLSGQILMLPFFPKGMQTVLNLLPFASTQNTPFQIYNGIKTGSEAFAALLIQVFWTAVLILIGKLWMKKALRKVVLQGG